MFGTTTYAAARTRYRDIDLGSKVEGASPHRLIAILFEELGKALDTLAAGLAAGGPRDGTIKRRARANSILLGLEASLDHAQGGSLSLGLAAVYREARRLIASGCETADPAPVTRARDMIAEIAEAWAAIG